MLDKTLLRNDRWHITIGMLGFGPVQIQSADGHSETANAAERRHLLDSLVALDRRRLPLGEFMAVRAKILSDFAAGIFEQRGGSPLPMVYDIVFRNKPGAQIDLYINAVRNRLDE